MIKDPITKVLPGTLNIPKNKNKTKTDILLREKDLHIVTFTLI